MCTDPLHKDDSTVRLRIDQEEAGPKSNRGYNKAALIESIIKNSHLSENSTYVATRRTGGQQRRGGVAHQSLGTRK